MLHKILTALAKTIIGLAVFSLFGWAVLYIEKEEEADQLPLWLVRNVKAFVDAPNVVGQAVRSLQELPLVYVESDPNFEPIHNLEEDVTILTSYAPKPWKRTIALLNLRTGEELKTWQVDRLATPNNRIVHAIMLADSSIVYSLQGFTGLIRIDKNSKRLWKQADIGHHHSLNLGVDSTLWATSYHRENKEYIYFGGEFSLGKRSFPFIVNTISQLNLDGEILYEKSVLEILVENDLEYLLLKSDSPGDPLHINDCQPVLENGPYWNTGDVWISSRNGSWLMLYRPSTGKVIRLVEGPFRSQHDIDIESDSTILFFNNNSMTLRGERPDGWTMSDNPLIVEKFHSQIMRYYLEDGSFEPVENEVLKQHDLFTYTEGLLEALPSGGYLIEEQNASVLWVVKDGSVLYKDVLKSPYDGYHHISNWARLMP